MTKQLTDLDHLGERIGRASQHVVDLKAQLKTAIAARDELIVAGYDEAGMKLREVTKHSDLSPAQVMRVLAASSSD